MGTSAEFDGAPEEKVSTFIEKVGAEDDEEEAGSEQVCVCVFV